ATGPEMTQPEQNFGLARFDMTHKPAYTAMKNTIALLQVPGATNTGGTLHYTLTAPSSVHHTLLQKSDGTTYLLLWNEVSSWNLTTQSDINNTDLSVTVSLAYQSAEA